MSRLYLLFYIALLVSLVLFGFATASVWHLAGGPMERAALTLSKLVQNVLPAAAAPASPGFRCSPTAGHPSRIPVQGRGCPRR